MRIPLPPFGQTIPVIQVLPYLYRYENSKFIDDFFDKGNIRISSFADYSSYLDNELGDKHEGSAMTVLKGENDYQTMVMTTAGSKSLCFCTSTVLDEDLKAKFKRDSAFRIIDPHGFIVEITRSLTRVNSVYMGHCIYLDDRVIMNKAKHVSVEQFQVSEIDKNIDVNKVFNTMDPGADPCFLKKKIYQHQSEFRIIWNTSREVKEGIIINCPEAVKYCERIF